jgi:hypothetical protein
MSKKHKESGNTESGKGKQAIKEGGTAVLYGGSQRILVRDVKLLCNGKHKGVIFGFSPSFSHEYRGLKVGDEMSFSADDVIRDA